MFGRFGNFGPIEILFEFFLKLGVLPVLLISIFLVYLSVYFVEFFHELIASVIFEIVVLNGCVWFGAQLV